MKESTFPIQNVGKRICLANYRQAVFPGRPKTTVMRIHLKISWNAESFFTENLQIGHGDRMIGRIGCICDRINAALELFDNMPPRRKEGELGILLLFLGCLFPKYK